MKKIIVLGKLRPTKLVKIAVAKKPVAVRIKKALVASLMWVN
jgi:hypothetical protein